MWPGTADNVEEAGLSNQIHETVNDAEEFIKSISDAGAEVVISGGAISDRLVGIKSLQGPSELR